MAEAGSTLSVGRFLQHFSKLPRVLTQQFPRSRHLFFLIYSGLIELINAVENFADLSLFACSTDNCEDTLAKFGRPPRNAGRRLPFECLPIQTPFACDHDVGVSRLRFEADDLCDDIKSRSNLRAAKAH